MKELSNFDIDRYYQDEDAYMGCYSKDTLPDKMLRNKFYIINLDNNDGPGAHWVCVIGLKDLVFYFDSYAMPPPENVKRFCKTLKLPCYCSNYQLQSLNSILCGYYCLYFIHTMYFNKQTFLDTLKVFSNDSVANDKYIEKYYSNSQTGSGFLTDTISRLFTTNPRNEFPPDVRNLLAKIGDIPITRIVVCRTPVIGILQKVMNVLSLGMLKQKLKQYNYDTLFHLYIIVQLQSGNMIRFEKNHVINMEYYKPDANKNGECRPVSFYEPLTLNKMLVTTIANYPMFFQYDSVKANCQDFVMNIIRYNNLNTDTSFIKQKAEDLIPWYLARLNRKVTDAASSFDVIISGRGNKNL